LPTPANSEEPWIEETLFPSRAGGLALSVIMGLLKTKDESVSFKSLSEGLRLPQERVLEAIRRLEEENIVKRSRGNLEAISLSAEERLKLAIVAVRYGARIEESAQALSWKEFESFCTRVLEENGYSCIHGFRFTSAKGSRYECDVVALSKPMLLLADCKHYAGRVSGLHAIVGKQSERTIALNKIILTVMRRIPQIAAWGEAVTIPVVITLFPERIAIVDSVPIVPAFKLNQFIQELPANIDKIAHFTVKLSKQKKLV
jgi:DNA-binding Lrp family transcriptional regulator